MVAIARELQGTGAWAERRQVAVGERPRGARAERKAVVVRRRRAAAVLLVVSLLALGIVLGRLSRVAQSGAPAAHAPVPIARTAYVVQPGDTLWHIARTLRPRGDVRPLVGQLARSLHGMSLRPGERILLPDGVGTGG